MFLEELLMKRKLILPELIDAIKKRERCITADNVIGMAGGFGDLSPRVNLIKGMIEEIERTKKSDQVVMCGAVPLNTLLDEAILTADRNRSIILPEIVNLRERTSHTFDIYQYVKVLISIQLQLMKIYHLNEIITIIQMTIPVLYISTIMVKHHQQLKNMVKCEEYVIRKLIA